MGKSIRQKAERKWGEIKEYFINFTNHPSDMWGEKQRKAAMEYGEIIDIPFPSVSPQGDENYIDRLARQYIQKILELRPRAVLCQGEFCLAYQVISKLRKKGIQVLAACSERIVKDAGQSKEVMFVFGQFRQYR